MIRSALLALVAVAPIAAAQSIELDVFASGAFQVPTNGSPGAAKASLQFDTATRTLTYDVTVSGLLGSITVGHIHNAPAGSNGPILFPLTQTGPATFQGTTAALTIAQRSELLSENLYVNVHSTQFPGGELRGQIRMPRALIAGNGSGAEQTPPNGSPGEARGIFTYLPATKSLEFEVTTGDLLGTATVAHLHRAPEAVPGPIIVNLGSATGGTFSGTTSAIVDSDLALLFAGGFYLNVHTTAFPGGEVRDQVLPGPLNATGTTLSVSNGGSLCLSLSYDVEQAGRLYLLAGTNSGTLPGTVLNGVTVPLNFDSFTLASIAGANAPPFNGTIGFLDANGGATADITVPPSAPSTLVGLSFDFAFVVVDVTGLGTVAEASNPVPLFFVP